VPIRGEVPHRGPADGIARPKSTAGYAVTFSVSACPARQFRAITGIGEQVPLGVTDQVEQPDRLLMVGEVKCRTLCAGCLYQFGDHAWWHGTIAERPSVGAPCRDGGMQFGVVLGWVVWRGQPERCQQQRLPWIGEQPDHRLASGYRDRQAQVEQGSA